MTLVVSGTSSGLWSRKVPTCTVLEVKLPWRSLLMVTVPSEPPLAASAGAFCAWTDVAPSKAMAAASGAREKREAEGETEREEGNWE
jgi:hypothetical protein